MEFQIQEYLNQISEWMMEAQARGLTIERTVETDAGPRGLNIQQHLVGPADQGIPEITVRLWERVRA